MAELKVNVADFSLTSTYKCQEVYAENNSSGIPDSYKTTTPSTKTVVKTFAFALPPDSTNVSAVLYATTGSGAYGSNVNTINGVSVGSSTTVQIPVSITASTTYVNIPFVYQCKATLHKTHGVENYTHYSSMTYSDVYLVVTYTSNSTAVQPVAKTGTATVSNSEQIWCKGTGAAGHAWTFTVSGLPSGAVVTAATLSFACGNTYNAPSYNRVYWGTSTSGTQLWYKSGSGGGTTYTVDLTSRVTGNGSYSLYFYKTSSSNSNVYYGGIKVTINYTYYVYPTTAPTTVQINGAESAYVAKNGTATLTWNDGAAATNNAITGYKIYVDGALYSQQDSSVRSLSIPAYSEGAHIWTVRTAGASVDSADSVGVYCYTYGQPTAPSDVTVTPAAVAPGEEALLEWDGATDGVYNPITGYHVYSSDSVDGTRTFIGETEETALVVSAPSSADSSTYFWVYTIGERGWNSDASAYATVSTFAYTAPSAPTRCFLTKALSDVDVTLSWEGAEDGDGNAITGYEIQRCESTDNAIWGGWSTASTATATDWPVSPPEKYGNYYWFRVRAVGEISSSDWTYCENTLRRDHAPISFTDPTLVVRETNVKAIHMTELQNAINMLLDFYGLITFGMTDIISGETPLSDWTNHVNEIRDAIDFLSTYHDDWLDIPVNCPKADVLQQLRDVLLDVEKPKAALGVMKLGAAVL